MFSSTTAVSSSVSVHRLRPLGGREQASAISFASAAPSKMRLRADLGECLRVNAESRPSSTNSWRVRAMVSMLVSSASAIRLSLQASPASEASAFSRMRAFSSWPAGALPLLISVLSRSRSSSPSLTTYFLTAGCFAVTPHLRVCRKYRFRDWPQNQRREALALQSRFFYCEAANRLNLWRTMIRKSWSGYAPVETTLELLASALRD